MILAGLARRYPAKLFPSVCASAVGYKPYLTESKPSGLFIASHELSPPQALRSFVAAT